MKNRLGGEQELKIEIPGIGCSGRTGEKSWWSKLNNTEVDKGRIVRR